MNTSPKSKLMLSLMKHLEVSNAGGVRWKRSKKIIPTYYDEDEKLLCISVPYRNVEVVLHVNFLVAVTHVPNDSDNKKKVRHKNGNVLDCSADNLEWTSE